ncbi:MAG TPA: hypothetical protein VF791_19390 [Pyrinomonadaceae bacterium]
MKAGILATVCAGIPLKLTQAAVGGKGDPSIIKPGQPSPGADQEILNYYTKSTFDPYVKTKFRVHLSPSNTRTLTLLETEDYLQSSSKAATAVSPDGECFSLLLTLPPGKPFEQGTYTIEHPALGAFPMFLVAVNEHTRTAPDYYEAIIYRRQQFSDAPEPTVVTEARQATNATAAQPTRNWWFVSADSPAAKLNAKIERETFNKDLLTAAGASAAAEKRKKAVRATWLTMAQDPGVSGLKLGMTSEQVLALFPGSKDDKDVRFDLDRPPSKFGVSGFTIRPQKYSSKSKFDGISQIVLTLLDNRVSTLYVGYDGPLWEHVDEFVAKFSKGRNVPAADSWEAYTGMDTQLKSLKCKDFEISLFAGGQNLSINYVQLRDLVALQKYKERRAKAKG